MGPKKEIHHCGDNLTGEGSGDDEVIKIKLSKLPENIVLVQFYVDIYEGMSRKQHFGNVRNAFIRLLDKDDDKKEICRYTLGPEFDMYTGVVMGSAQRTSSGEWEFVAEGKPIGNKIAMNSARSSETTSLMSRPQDDNDGCSCVIL